MKRAAAAAAFSLALAGCGYAELSLVIGIGDGEDAWLEIESPTTAGYWETGDSAIALAGSAFVPPGSTCSGTLGTLAPGYRVSWSNTATGQSGLAEAWLDCSGLAEVRWRTAPIALAIGTNPIAVGALDADGRSGSDAITVYRYTR
ncbi:hypothetical protein M6I34_02765 [Burkholderiaceae bacterium FT117]|uniref:hypothetical protein n=1 Tax=Zeimonas sediminis TaxID=2944268 RepID=UPI0023431833|nr:hypothetical protein [Zeimonas sediminis]MCM5569420.1 hypothetical protein [Zeimonas sediminis]